MMPTSRLRSDAVIETIVGNLPPVPVTPLPDGRQVKAKAVMQIRRSVPEFSAGDVERLAGVWL
jgi:hypothetical protein